MLQLTFFDIGLSWAISLNKMFGDGIDGLKNVERNELNMTEFISILMAFKIDF